MQEYPVEGLETNDGIELLRKQGVQTRQATEVELRTAVGRCAGHALSLKLLASILRSNRSLSLQSLFNNPMYAQLWTGNIARNLLDYIFEQQLNDLQRNLLRAFSVYREPVPLEAAQAVVDAAATTKIPGSLLDALNVLLAQHLLQDRGNECYQLHVIVANYAKDHFDAGSEEAHRQALKSAHAKAAQYYVHYAETNCQPRDKRRSADEVKPLIEAVWQYCQAGQWQEAYDLMLKEGLFSDLRRWGRNAILLELCQLLLPSLEWQPERSQAARIYADLGLVYHDLGKKQEALAYLKQALSFYREVGNRGGEGTTLHNIGALYFERSRYDVALACFLLARGIFEEVLSPDRDAVQQWIDGLLAEVGEDEFARLLSWVEPQAEQIVELALKDGL
jgi:tetratricopeptide (TPR) repeat protein